MYFYPQIGPLSTLSWWVLQRELRQLPALSESALGLCIYLFLWWSVCCCKAGSFTVTVFVCVQGGGRSAHPSDSEGEGGRAKPTRGYTGSKVHRVGEEPKEAAAWEAAVAHGQDRLTKGQRINDLCTILEFHGYGHRVRRRRHSGLVTSHLSND